MRTTACIGAAALGLLLAGAGPAWAEAAPPASCVGTVVSAQAPGGQLDVAGYKAEAQAAGFTTFGGFVADAAGQHLGSLAACTGG